MCFLFAFPLLSSDCFIGSTEEKRGQKQRAAEIKFTMRRERNYHRTEVTLMEKIKQKKIIRNVKITCVKENANVL